MKEELNIAAILKDKPLLLKFYSTTFGRITFNGVHKGKVYFFSEDTNAHSVKQNGKMYDGGDCIIFPSKEMRDWDKFAWKKGDVLTDNISTICMFEGWANSDYTEFNAKYTLHLIVSTNAENEVCKTSNFVQVLKEEDKQSYLATAETYFNINITKGSLQIEQPRQEFKDGDIAFADYGNRQNVFIVSGKTGLSEGYNSFISLDLRGLTLSMGYRTGFFKKNLCELRLATEEEKKQLFSSLEKEGKRWDAENKMVVDLKPKCEFKPFDKVLGRNEKDDVWEAELFSHYKEESQYPFRCIGFSRKYCIPYNEETAHLLGTTDDWEGGEHD